jgi:CRISPR-associated endonuclease Csn1
VNELIDEHGKIDEIKVEMARDLKISKSQRTKFVKNKKIRKRER